MIGLHKCNFNEDKQWKKSREQFHFKPRERLGNKENDIIFEALKKRGSIQGTRFI